MINGCPVTSLTMTHGSILVEFSYPRTMIPVAVFREFPAKTRRKLAVSCRNPPGNVRNSTLESGNRIRLPVSTGSCRFRAEPEKSGHRIRSPEYCYHEISGIQQIRQFPCRIARPGMFFILPGNAFFFPNSAICM